MKVFFHKKTIIITLIILLLTSVLACLGVSYSKGSKVFAAYIDDSTIKTQYMVGDEFVLGSAILNCDGVKVESSGSYLILPNGKAISKEKINLSLDGEYTAVYYTENEGRYFEAKIDFLVASELYSVQSERSSAKYGKPDNYKTEGILLSLYTGDVFTYNKVINVKDYTNQNGLLTFYAIPETMGVADCTDVIIRLTDAYDETNFVDVKISNVSYMGTWADPHVYCKGAANGQTFTGINNGKPRQDYAGLAKYFTLTGVLSHTVVGSLDSSLFTYSIDYGEKQLWTNGGTDTTGMIIDLDDDTIFPDVWKGFTTGECFLSMFGQGYQTLNANYVITEIDGQDITDNTFNMNDGISINIDFDDYTEETLPCAMIGKPYKIFQAEAVGLYQKNLDITTNVIYNYGSDKAINISIEDGCFTPMLEGYYSIVYHVKDGYGVESTRVLDVYAKEKSSLTVDYSVIYNSCNIMDRVSVLKINGFENAIGVVYNEAYAVLNDKVKYKLDESFSFQPEYSGTYKIKLTTKDYIETVENEFDFNVNASDIYAVSGQPLVPKYFIKNARYTIDSLKGTSYAKGYPEEVDVDIYYQEDGGEEKRVNDNSIIVNANDNVKILYKIGNKIYKQFYGQVVDVGYGKEIDITKYFIEKDGQIEYFYEYDLADRNDKLDNDNLKIRTSEQSLIEFVNAVDVNDFAFDFKIGGPESNFRKLNIYLEDCITGKSLKFTFTENDDKTQFILNDSDWREVNLDFSNETEPVNFNLIFSNLTGRTTADKKDYIIIKKYSDGTEFKGFTNGKAYLKIELEEVSGESVISLVRFNAHSFSSSRKNKDNIKPVLEVESRSGNVYLNEEFILYGARYYDVLDPFVEASLQILTPNNEFYQNESGVIFNGVDVTTDYSIKFNEYGDYTIIYTIKDGVENERVYSYGISVVDEEPPQIILSNIVYEASKGKKYSVANYTVIDNMTDANEIKVFVYVIDTGRHFTEIKDGKYVFENAGEYEIVYLVFDSEFNMMQVSYKVTV